MLQNMTKVGTQNLVTRVFSAPSRIDGLLFILLSG